MSDTTRNAYTPSSYGFLLYILTYPLALTHFIYYFTSTEEEGHRLDAKLLPSTLFLCLLVALPMIVAGVNVFLAAESSQMDALEDGWSAKYANVGRDLFDMSIIRDLDVSDVNRFVYQNRSAGLS